MLLILVCIFGALAAFHLVPLLIPPLRDPDWLWPDPKVRDLVQPDPTAVTKKFVLFPITHFLFGIAFAFYVYVALSVAMQLAILFSTHHAVRAVHDGFHGRDRMAQRCCLRQMGEAPQRLTAFASLRALCG